MRTISPYVRWSLAVSAVFLFAATAFGQDGGTENDPNQPDLPRPRPNLFRELGLSVDQVQRIRTLNADLKPAREAARHQLRESNRELDQAIYAEVVDDATVANKLLRYQEAQAALAKLNFENELAIRKILTPDQLIRFREIRKRFAEARQNIQRRRQENNRNRRMQPPANSPNPGEAPAKPPVRRP